MPRLRAKSDAPAATIRQIAHAAGGHATCFTPRADAEPFTPLPPALLRFHQQLKQHLDPRGRIYLIKQMLEGEPVTQKTPLHLDRCLSCRNCETTCPSGVSSHALLDIGRTKLERRIVRLASERLLREGLRRAIPNPAVFDVLLKTGRAMRPFLPAALGRKIPRRSAQANAGTKLRPASRHPRKMLMLEAACKPRAAAARSSRNTGICCATTLAMRQKRSGSAN
jgi:glycolate oxidase iron-sulfur subunit